MRAVFLDLRCVAGNEWLKAYFPRASTAAVIGGPPGVRLARRGAWCATLLSHALYFPHEWRVPAGLF